MDQFPIYNYLQIHTYIYVEKVSNSTSAQKALLQQIDGPHDHHLKKGSQAREDLLCFIVLFHSSPTM